MPHSLSLYNVSTMEYQAVWWRLFHSQNSSAWSSVLTLATLLFSLPVSNGKLERTFSLVNIIKSSKRASLGSDTLKDLLTLNTEKVELNDFSPDSAIDLWWGSKTRKPSHGPRKSYKNRTPHQFSETASLDTEAEESMDLDTNTDSLLLGDWDEWMNN